MLESATKCHPNLTSTSNKQEVKDDLSRNSMLSKQYQNSFGGDSGHCNCDCAGHNPQLHVKAATMLEQVGENVFFGPCASCPCMKSNSVEAEIEELGKDLQVLLFCKCIIFGLSAKSMRTVSSYRQNSAPSKNHGFSCNATRAWGRWRSVLRKACRRLSRYEIA